MTCKKCGTEFRGNFCPKCGTPARPTQGFQQPIPGQPMTPQKGKTPVYKKWWFWSIIIGIAIIFLVCFVALLRAGQEISEAAGHTVSDSVTQTLPQDETSYATETETDTESESAAKSKIESNTKAPSQGSGNNTQANASKNDTLTMGQKNALKKAESYLSFSAFSREGLIDQLEYEKFSHDDAVYAVDHCGANWNEQALKKGKSYLDYTAFSYQGLIDQLEYEKFTTEQATYAADHCGANWNEQAAKKAKSYLEFTAFSRDSLIEQLEYEKFTHEQAVYGAEANGY